MANRVLDIQDLHVSFDTYAGEVKAVRGVTLHVDEGEVLAIVGESGCGKSVTAQTIMKLNPMPPARIVSGTIDLAGHDIVKANERAMQKIRGRTGSIRLLSKGAMQCWRHSAPGVLLISSLCWTAVRTVRCAPLSGRQRSMGRS